jgi:ABC-type lipoprotein export system ATPase subunit
MRVSLSYKSLPRQRTANAAVVMDHFGIGRDVGRHVIARDLELPIAAGDVVCFTGASGSGKSSLLRAVVERLRLRGRRGARALASKARGLVDLDALELPERLLIDALDLPAGHAMRLLSACGLGEAQLMLRTPAELSDGQRFRFRLALALARKPAWIVADEFTSTLDRTLARIVAYNVRREADRTGTGFVLATAHEDVLDDLRPTLHVRCGLDGGVDWSARGAKKKRSASGSECWSRPVFARTGRTSLAGIIGAAGCRRSGLSRCSGIVRARTTPARIEEGGSRIEGKPAASEVLDRRSSSPGTACRSASACSRRRRSPCGSGIAASDCPGGGRGRDSGS